MTTTTTHHIVRRKSDGQWLNYHSGSGWTRDREHAHNLSERDIEARTKRYPRNSYDLIRVTVTTTEEVVTSGDTGTWRDAIGASPSEPGETSAEESIRRGRD